MDPIVEPVETNRAPTLQGTQFLHPTGCLDRIASFYGLPNTNIATISVTSKTELLYRAVVEYASLLPPQNQAFVKPLFIAQEDAFERKLKNESSYGSDEEDTLQEDRKRRRLEEKKTPTLKFKWSLGETTVIWPPPPYLEGERLAEKKRNQVPSTPTTSVTRVERMDISESESNNFVLSSDKNDLIYLVHYFFKPEGEGTPLLFRSMSSSSGPTRVILMASSQATKLRKFAQEVMQWYIDKNYIEPDSTQYRLHRFKHEDCGGYWEEEGRKRARPPRSVILHGDQMKDILSDVKEFLSPSTRNWYASHGLQYRRCFLFYGPPGTGKTSTVRAIASQFEMECYFLNMTSSSFSNQTLADAFSKLPSKNALLVLEDVDTLFNEDRKCESSKDLTFSGLLNSLDGFLSVDGVITCMTTNHIVRLDDSLLRAGRVDRRFFFGHPSALQIGNLFRTFYPAAPHEVSKSFAEAVLARPPEEKAQNFATLQELFVSCRKKTAEECIELLPTFFGTFVANDAA